MLKKKKRFQGLDCSSDSATRPCLFLSHLHSAVCTRKTRLWTLLASWKQLFTFFFISSSPVSQWQMQEELSVIVFVMIATLSSPLLWGFRQLVTVALSTPAEECVYMYVRVCVFVFTLMGRLWTPISTCEPKANEPSRKKILSLTMLTFTAESSTLQNSVLASNQLPAIVPVSMQLKKSNYWRERVLFPTTEKKKKSCTKEGVARWKWANATSVFHLWKPTCWWSGQINIQSCEEVLLHFITCLVTYVWRVLVNELNLSKPLNSISYEDILLQDCN